MLYTIFSFYTVCGIRKKNKFVPFEYPKLRSSWLVSFTHVHFGDCHDLDRYGFLPSLARLEETLVFTNNDISCKSQTSVTSS